MATEDENDSSEQCHPGIDSQKLQQDEDAHSTQKEQEYPPVDQFVRELGNALQIWEAVGKEIM